MVATEMTDDVFGWDSAGRGGGGGGSTNVGGTREGVGCEGMIWLGKGA